MAMKAVYRAPDELMANTIKDLLDQGGVPALVHSFQIPAYDGIAQVMRSSWGEVLVEESAFERARELVEGFLESGAGDGAAPGGD
jgi:hypothetical protein